MALGVVARLAGAVLGGALLMGAEPAPSPPMSPMERGAALAKVLPTPRLFELTMTTDGKASGPTQYCVSGETIARQMDGMSAILAKDPKLTEGCTQTVDRKPDGAVHVEWTCAKGSGLMGVGCKQTIDKRADGSARIEMICDKAAGAATALHMTMEADGQMKEMRQRMEVELGVVSPPRMLVTEGHMVQVGACPADLKPGEARMADGTKMDMTGLFAGPATKPAAAKPAEAH